MNRKAYMSDGINKTTYANTVRYINGFIKLYFGFNEKKGGIIKESYSESPSEDFRLKRPKIEGIIKKQYRFIELIKEKLNNYKEHGEVRVNESKGVIEKKILGVRSNLSLEKKKLKSDQVKKNIINIEGELKGYKKQLEKIDEHKKFLEKIPILVIEIGKLNVSLEGQKLNLVEDIKRFSEKLKKEKDQIEKIKRLAKVEEIIEKKIEGKSGVKSLVTAVVIILILAVIAWLLFGGNAAP